MEYRHDLNAREFLSLLPTYYFPNPKSKEEWVDLALKNNYQLKAVYLRKNAAKNNARSAASNHLPKIDIVGSKSESETNQFNYEGFDINGHDRLYQNLHS